MSKGEGFHRAGATRTGRGPFSTGPGDPAGHDVPENQAPGGAEPRPGALSE